jgi:3-oxoacyl-[acyl-carrier protein] reductase
MLWPHFCLDATSWGEAEALGVAGGAFAGRPEGSTGSFAPPKIFGSGLWPAVRVGDHDLRMSPRVALVTGVGRRSAIGFAVARALLEDRYSVMTSSFSSADDAPESATVGADLSGELAGTATGRFDHAELDLGTREAPAQLIEMTVSRFRRLDVLIAAHAHDSKQSLGEMTAEELDRAWAVNARASALLVQAFDAAYDEAQGHGRVVLFTSGQHVAPMPSELPYAISKGAIHQMTLSLADSVADRGITVNAINPGPVDTGWPGAELKRALEPAFPARRWGRPEDITPVVRWLVSPESAWMTGQVLDVEGGFRRWAV